MSKRRSNIFCVFALLIFFFYTRGHSEEVVSNEVKSFSSLPSLSNDDEIFLREIVFFLKENAEGFLENPYKAMNEKNTDYLVEKFRSMNLLKLIQFVCTDNDLRNPIEDLLENEDIAFFVVSGLQLELSRSIDSGVPIEALYGLEETLSLKKGDILEHCIEEDLEFFKSLFSR